MKSPIGLMTNGAVDAKSEGGMEKLQKAWELRMERELGECRRLFSEITEEFFSSPITEKSFVSLSLPDVLLRVDYLLLLVSLKRADGQIAESKVFIQMIERVLQSRHQPYPFQLYFQKGVTALFEADYSHALDLFVQASEAAVTLMEKITAQSNTVYCLENLGMAYEGACEVLEKLFTKAPADAFLESRAHFAALRMRQALRSGNFSEAFKVAIPSIISQATHFRYWLSELPFHSHFGAFTSLDKERYLTQSPNRYQKLYHLRTFQGIVHPDDLDSFRESDYCDRLYLWVWRWLADPNGFPLEKVMALLQNTTLQTLSPRLTQEDFQLLRNSVLWLSLFLPAQALTLKKLAHSLSRETSRPYPFFDFEAQVIEYLLALQAEDESTAGKLEALKKHPLWKEKSLFLASLLIVVVSEKEKGLAEPLVGLAKRLRQICIGQKTTDKDKLYVDLITYRLVWKGGKERAISETMCFALDLLFRKECVPFEEFGLICFGLRRFDSFTHNAKVYNLIARIKTCLPKDLTIKTKGGRIYAIGAWKNVQFERPAGCEEVVQRQAEWRHLFVKELALQKPPTKKVRPNYFLAEAPGKKILTRKELEALTGKSRATAARLIAQWIEQGVVKRMGTAKNTKYLLVSERGTEVGL